MIGGAALASNKKKARPELAVRPPSPAYSGASGAISARESRVVSNASASPQDRLRRAVDEAVKQTRAEKAKEAKKAAQEAAIALLQQQVAALIEEGEETREALLESRGEIEGLRNSLGDVRREVGGVADRVERVSTELAQTSAPALAGMRVELQKAAAELAGLKAHCSMLGNGLEAAQTVQADHGAQLKDIVVLRTQQAFMQTAADRAESSFSEQTRMMGELRAELAGLMQKHAGLAGSSAAEHAGHRQAHTGLRQSLDAAAMQLESMQGQVAALHVSEASVGQTSEKLKKAARRHELLVQRLNETQEARSSELRGLIKSLAEQLQPLQESSRRHASQIEEVSSGINVLAELLRFTNRARATPEI
jgi:chromosome segregation ATPase